MQGGVCAICFGPGVASRRLAVDHDHNTGKVRGLLCADCNRALGGFKEDPTTLGRATTYILCGQTAGV